MTIQDLAKEAYGHFTQKPCPDGRTIWVNDVKEGDWVNDLTRAAHDNGNVFPDDFRYEAIVRALSALADCDDPDDAEVDPDVYTSNLTAWLASSIDRVEYLSEALRELDPPSAFALLAYAQSLELREVLDSVRSSLEAQLTESQLELSERKD